MIIFRAKWMTPTAISRKPWRCAFLHRTPDCSKILSTLERHFSRRAAAERRASGGAGRSHVSSAVPGRGRTRRRGRLGERRRGASTGCSPQPLHDSQARSDRRGHRKTAYAFHRRGRGCGYAGIAGEGRYGSAETRQSVRFAGAEPISAKRLTARVWRIFPAS